MAVRNAASVGELSGPSLVSAENRPRMARVGTAGAKAPGHQCPRYPVGLMVIILFVAVQSLRASASSYLVVDSSFPSRTIASESLGICPIVGFSPILDAGFTSLFGEPQPTCALREPLAADITACIVTSDKNGRRLEVAASIPNVNGAASEPQLALPHPAAASAPLEADPTQLEIMQKGLPEAPRLQPQTPQELEQSDTGANDPGSQLHTGPVKMDASMESSIDKFLQSSVSQLQAPGLPVQKPPRLRYKIGKINRLPLTPPEQQLLETFNSIEIAAFAKQAQALFEESFKPDHIRAWLERLPAVPPAVAVYHRRVLDVLKRRDAFMKQNSAGHGPAPAALAGGAPFAAPQGNQVAGGGPPAPAKNDAVPGGGQIANLRVMVMGGGGPGNAAAQGGADQVPRVDQSPSQKATNAPPKKKRRFGFLKRLLGRRRRKEDKENAEGADAADEIASSGNGQRRQMPAGLPAQQYAAPPAAYGGYRPRRLLGEGQAAPSGIITTPVAIPRAMAAAQNGLSEADHQVFRSVAGRGGFGMVFRFPVRNNPRLLVKVFHDGKLALDQLFYEIFAAHYLFSVPKHPNVMRFGVSHNPIGRDHTTGEIYLFLQEVKGVHLGRFIARKTKPYTRLVIAMQIFPQLFSAIRHLHKWGIAHNDIKPENVVLTEKKYIRPSNAQMKLDEVHRSTFQITLIDFGLCNMLSRGRDWISTGHFEVCPEIERVREYNNTCNRVKMFRKRYGPDHTKVEEARMKVDDMREEGMTWQPMLVDMWQLAQTYKLFLGRDILQRSDFDECRKHLRRATGLNAEVREEAIKAFLAEFTGYVQSLIQQHQREVAMREAQAPQSPSSRQFVPQ
eukprot:GHVT01045010.1.p1 GENE.GHVT01045010.1~~GHVT01045010.1.p1  ORF type:complete len:847 (-),score=90.57 GHVT01045010.1:546-3086(-)